MVKFCTKKDPKVDYKVKICHFENPDKVKNPVGQLTQALKRGHVQENPDGWSPYFQRMYVIC